MRSSFRLAATLSAAALAAFLVPASPAQSDAAVLRLCGEHKGDLQAMGNSAQSTVINTSSTASFTGPPLGRTFAAITDQYTFSPGRTDLLRFLTGANAYIWEKPSTSMFSFVRVNNGCSTAPRWPIWLADSLASSRAPWSTTGVDELNDTGNASVLGR
ncbi:hypothetical protein AB0N79_38180 [Streptomyces microflavus]|uniref:hypothetical protein n=1 Tax=Streptomyces microflavus TaxID=1919 RepID=UPI003431F762